MASSNAKTVTLITGANAGIGFETAKLIAKNHPDYLVLLSGRRKEAVDEAVSKLQSEGISVDPLVLDVSDDQSIAAAVQEVEAKYGRLDVLINNAGVSRPPGVEYSEQLAVSGTRSQWQYVFNTNVFGVAAVTDAFLPLMKKSVGSGSSNGPKRIVFVSSSLGSLQEKVDPAMFTHSNVGRTYTTSKAALNMLALHYAVQFENDKDNWKINLTCPGYCATGLNSFRGFNTAESGAINSERLATLGVDGPYGTYTDKDRTILW